MSNGLRPGPWNGSDSVVIDDGTLARIGTPPPGSIGLDAQNGGAMAPPPPALSDQILAFVRGKIDSVHGDGECFTLADDALKAAGARSAADYGKVAPDVDYVWGKAVTRTALQPGDIIQMKGYRVEIEETTTDEKGGQQINEIFEERPHHTAIVESIGTDGRVTVVEQNYPVGTGVTRNVLHLTSATYSSGSTTSKVKVKGTMWYYRAQSR